MNDSDEAQYVAAQILGISPGRRLKDTQCSTG
jgi:hypothetical protein